MSRYLLNRHILLSDMVVFDYCMFIYISVYKINVASGCSPYVSRSSASMPSTGLVSFSTYVVAEKTCRRPFQTLRSHIEHGSCSVQSQRLHHFFSTWLFQVRHFLLCVVLMILTSLFLYIVIYRWTGLYSTMLWLIHFHICDPRK